MTNRFHTYFSLTALLAALLLTGCLHSGKPANASSVGQVTYEDLDRACARLVLELLADSGWQEFSRQYAQRVQETKPDASALECVPLMFLSVRESNLTTRGGSPIHVSYLTNKLKEVTGNAKQLQKFLDINKKRFPELAKAFSQASNLEERLATSDLPEIRWSAYIGKDKEAAVAGVEFIAHDPRVDTAAIETGKILPPGLAFSVEMTQNTLDTTKYVFHARIVDFLKTDGTTGEGLEVWSRQIAIPE